MPIDRKRFLVGFLVTNVVMVGVVAGMVSAGVGAAVPAAGVGTFTIEFDELRGEEFEQRSAMDSTDSCGRYSVNVAQMDSGTIEGLHLYKDVEMPIGDTVRVSIESESADFQGLNQQFTHLEGDIAFDEDQVTEYDTESDQMRISASSITIEDGTIHTDSQFITQLSLDELSVDTIQNPDDDAPEPPETDCLSENSTAA
ncbi:hypothetical protein [Natronorubrum sp. FCH18a]|uniref:hypothetical protein n=1 Tax=Natronorubrum sp. FCH18a TaxID=3447018 RepID=UPI003F5141D2